MTDSGSKKSPAARRAPAKEKKAVVSRKKNVQHTAKENIPGSLMSRLWEVAAAKKDSLPDLAGILDISYPYLMALARGERPTEKMERPQLVSAAKYLELPVGQVYLLAGVLQPEDFIFELTKDEKIQHALKAMRNDPLWAAYAPNDKVWKHADPSLKLLVCLLYERAARTSFFDGTESPVYAEKQ